jgi:hypothetical protein
MDVPFAVVSTALLAVGPFLLLAVAAQVFGADSRTAYPDDHRR